jgi:hypothetical protein
MGARVQAMRAAKAEMRLRRPRAEPQPRRVAQAFAVVNRTTQRSDTHLHVAGEVQAVARVHWGLVQVQGLVLVVDGDTERAQHAAEHTDTHVDGDDTLASKDTVTDLHIRLKGEQMVRSC